MFIIPFGFVELELIDRSPTPEGIKKTQKWLNAAL